MLLSTRDFFQILYLQTLICHHEINYTLFDKLFPLMLQKDQNYKRQHRI